MVLVVTLPLVNSFLCKDLEGPKHVSEGGDDVFIRKLLPKDLRETPREKIREDLVQS